MFDRGKAKVNILLQILVLNTFPRLSKIANCTLSEKDFILSKFTILAKSIETDNKLDLLSLEWLGLNILPATVCREICGIKCLIAFILTFFFSSLCKE
jgi:hypothetical protein